MSRRAARGRPPGLLIPPAVIGFAFLLLPTAGLLIRAPWHGLARIYSHTDVTDALRISVETSLQAVLVSLVLGVPLAWVLARVRVRGHGARARGGDDAARAAAGRRRRRRCCWPSAATGTSAGTSTPGSAGSLPFTSHAVVLAQTFVAMPFLVVTVEGALRTADAGLEEAAATLGATPLAGLQPGHPAADRAVAGRRIGALLGPRARRVRRHRDLRRQHPGPHADDADCRPAGIRQPARGRGRAEPGAAPDRARRADGAS